MKITDQFLAAGASPANGYTKRQIELLGLTWPPKKGWKKSIVGAEISDGAAEEFASLADRRNRASAPSRASENWCGYADRTDIFLYVLALEDHRFYVGLTSDLERRIEQHFSGSGAEWTKQHRPLRVLHRIDTGTQNSRDAEILENEVTYALMMEYGIENVRGGHFCQIDGAEVEAALRGHGVWDRIKQAQFRKAAVSNDLSWSDSLDHYSDSALRYYEAGSPDTLLNEVFAAGFCLTRFQHWSETFAPGISWAFWNKKGILPVLLSFKLGRPVATKLPSSYEVLAAALCRGSGGQHPLRRLFLLAWQTYRPPTTSKQAATVARFMSYLDDESRVDRQYDDFVSVLFPETRGLLRIR